MKILFVSDLVTQQLENAAHMRRRYSDVELVVSCGDMPSGYLEFITSVLSVPLFYVCGNHDIHYEERPPGGINLHRRILEYKGLTFVGLEGSMRYNKEPLQYSDRDMASMVWKFGFPLWFRRMRGIGVDVFVTHSPAKGIHDLPDLTHTGFKSFLKFMDRHKPRYMVHGHVHTYDNRVQTITQYKETCIMNVYPFKVLDIEPVVRGTK
ncbi:MAG: metallophosphoesterase family protein [Pleurocapsa minor GSE-CHR-MK-17-07R]|nr:metallophosphoesterase family protein [Pleurocapsa minor GSE-CHR-MK 17-07R]